MTKVIGITGGSGSGKTTLAKQLINNLDKSLLIKIDDYFVDYSKREKVKAPYCDKVVQCTQGYQNDNDYYKTFVETMLIRSEDSVINISELFGIFKEYVKDNYPTVTASISCNSFIEKLQKVYNIEVVGREVLNYSLRN